jgi:hypothetical protein
MEVLDLVTARDLLSVMAGYGIAINNDPSNRSPYASYTRMGLV